ncbi:MAG: SRPBCC family protein [Bacteroidota bacterium]
MKSTCIIIISSLFLLTSLQAQKKRIHIQTKTLISASPTQVYEVLKSLEQFPKWSPFLVADPNQKNYVKGRDGEIGSSFHWEGVAEKSQGYQTLAKLKENEYLRFECSIAKPFQSKPVFEYHLRQTEQGLLLRQDFELKLSGFDYFMIKLFGVKKKMSETNQLGLDRLKQYVEGEPVPSMMESSIQTSDLDK